MAPAEQLKSCHEIRLQARLRARIACHFLASVGYQRMVPHSGAAAICRWPDLVMSYHGKNTSRVTTRLVMHPHVHWFLISTIFKLWAGTSAKAVHQDGPHTFLAKVHLMRNRGCPCARQIPILQILDECLLLTIMLNCICSTAVLYWP